MGDLNLQISKKIHKDAQPNIIHTYSLYLHSSKKHIAGCYCGLVVRMKARDK